MGINEIRKLKEQSGLPQQKKIYHIPKQSEKKKKQMEQQRLSGDNKDDLWFAEARKEMTGWCLLCGSPTEKHNNETYHYSAAHILAKRKNMFPSIRHHPCNRIELCYHFDSCHSNYDNGIITLEDIKAGYPIAWEEIVRKFKIMYPAIATDEVKRIPDILLAEL